MQIIPLLVQLLSSLPVVFRPPHTTISFHLLSFSIAFDSFVNIRAWCSYTFIIYTIIFAYILEQPSKYLSTHHSTHNPSIDLLKH